MEALAAMFSPGDLELLAASAADAHPVIRLRMHHELLHKSVDTDSGHTADEPAIWLVLERPLAYPRAGRSLVPCPGALLARCAPFVTDS